MFWTNLLIDVLVVVYVLDCLFMGLVIMMQRSKQEGLGATFGGGVMDSTFGAQTSQVLVKATVYAAILFFVLSILLARLYSNRNNMLEQGSAVQQELMKPVATPVTTPAAPTPATTPVAPTTTPAPASATAPTAPAPTSATKPAPAPATK